MSTAMQFAIGLLGAALIALLVFMLFFWDRPVDEIPQETTVELSVEEQEIERTLAQLPREVTVEDRTVTFDQTTVEQTALDEYADGEASLEMQTGEDPVDYIERHIRSALSAREVQEQSEFYEYAVSFYRMNDRDGIIAFVRVMNIPDDSIGGEEERFDFVVNGPDWSLDSYAERVFCRRPAEGAWQPADQLCP